VAWVNVIWHSVRFLQMLASSPGAGSAPAAAISWPAPRGLVCIGRASQWDDGLVSGGV
jgi:hypothetical protein